MVVAMHEGRRQYPFKHLEITYFNATGSTTDYDRTILKNNVELHIFSHAFVTFSSLSYFILHLLVISCHHGIGGIEGSDFLSDGANLRTITKSI